MTIVSLVDEAPLPAAYGSPGYEPFVDLWARLVRPFDVAYTVSAITGLSSTVVAQLIGTAVATSPEAERLLDAMPHTIRSLATSMVTQHERCKGELRGPVLWSETMSARAASFGDGDLYVCATPSRAYDIVENRVLVAALVAVRDGALAVTEQADRTEQDSATFRTLKRNGSDAGRFVQHPSLQRVTREQPNGRALKRTRAGKKAKVYEPALQLLARAANPLPPEAVLAWCDRRTRAQQAVLAGLLNRLERQGVALGELRSDRGQLVAGPLAYRHGRLLGDERSPSGIRIGSLLVDVPDDPSERGRVRAEQQLAARAGGMSVAVVFEDDDLDEVVALVRAELASLRS